MSWDSSFHSLVNDSSQWENQLKKLKIKFLWLNLLWVSIWMSLQSLLCSQVGFFWSEWIKQAWLLSVKKSTDKSIKLNVIWEWSLVGADGFRGVAWKVHLPPSSLAPSLASCLSWTEQVSSVITFCYPVVEPANYGLRPLQTVRLSTFPLLSHGCKVFSLDDIKIN